MKEKSMYDQIESIGVFYPNNIAFSFMGKDTTYKKFIKQIDIVSKSLSKLGLNEDDVIAIIMTSTPQAITMIYAANKIGITVCLIDPLVSKEELLDDITNSKAKLVLTQDDFYAKVSSIIEYTCIDTIIVSNINNNLNVLKKVNHSLKYNTYIKKSHYMIKILSWQSFYRLGYKYKVVLKKTNNNNKIAIIMFDKGINGNSVGICLSNQNINSSSLKFISANPMIVPEDNLLNIMPISNFFGLIYGIHSVLSYGGTSILIPQYNSRSIIKTLIKSKCKYLLGSSSFFERIIQDKDIQEEDLSFLKGVFCIDQSLSIDMEHQINTFLIIHNASVTIKQGFGLVEASGYITFNPYDCSKQGSNGIALPDTKIMIYDNEKACEKPIGQVGEIIFSSPSNMIGYLNYFEETNKVKKIHSDGISWIHSGKFGYQDEDGFLYIKRNNI